MSADTSAVVRAALQAIDSSIEESALLLPGGAEQGGRAVPMYTSNVVSLCDLGLATTGQLLPIKDLCRYLNAKFCAGLFPAMISHSHETKCTHSLFSTSSCVTAGARSTEASLSSAMLLATTVGEFLDIRLQVTDFVVTNVSCNDIPSIRSS